MQPRAELGELALHGFDDRGLLGLCFRLAVVEDIIPENIGERFGVAPELDRRLRAGMSRFLPVPTYRAGRKGWLRLEV